MSCLGRIGMNSYSYLSARCNYGWISPITEIILKRVPVSTWSSPMTEVSRLPLIRKLFKFRSVQPNPLSSPRLLNCRDRVLLWWYKSTTLYVDWTNRLAVSALTICATASVSRNYVRNRTGYCAARLTDYSKSPIQCSSQRIPKSHLSMRKRKSLTRRMYW